MKNFLHIKDIPLRDLKKIISDVKKGGDKAVVKYEVKFSKVSSSVKKIKFSKKEINSIAKKINKDLKKSIDIAFDRIKRFHSKQKFLSFRYKDEFSNELSYKYLPIESVGVYVPGGTANYPSTVLMNCVPAIVAGVNILFAETDPNIVTPSVIVPPDNNTRDAVMSPVDFNLNDSSADLISSETTSNPAIDAEANLANPS